MTKCRGCGATLQHQDKNEIGYTPKIDSELCQRCFRLNNYDDLIKSYQDHFDNYQLLNEISNLDALIVWVVDLFDFESNIISGLNRHLMNKDILMVGTKRDLLPDSLGNQKLYHFLKRRLKEYGISVNEVMFTGDYGGYGTEDVLHAIDVYRGDRDVVIMGQANAGKSTLINALAATDLTISRYPGTTLDVMSIDMGDYIIYDTPGLINDTSLQLYVDADDLKKIVPSKVKPITYSSSSNQSYAIGGLVRIDVSTIENFSIVFYINEHLSVHRSSIEKADDLWNQQLGDLLVPVSEEPFAPLRSVRILKDRFDIVLKGIGFVSIIGNVADVKVSTLKSVDVIVRESLM